MGYKVSIMFHGLQYLIFIGAAAQILGAMNYIFRIFRGTVRPNRVSWLLWSIVPMISIAASLSAGVRWAVLPVFLSGFCPFMVFICSFVNRESFWKLQNLDYTCGASSFLALLFWALTKQPIVAIVFSIVSDALASVPTIVKAWKYPATESALTYSSGIFSSLTSFLVIKIWVFPAYGFQCYLIVIDCILVSAIYHKSLFEWLQARFSGIAETLKLRG
jgi:hypothetical protein